MTRFRVALCTALCVGLVCACNQASLADGLPADGGAPLAGGGDASAPPASVQEGEWLPGGETTNTLVGGDLAFTFPAANLTGPERGPFFSGDAFFNQAWVAAPSTTTARDGLGPTFNARSCSGCHFKDGRGKPPEPGEPLESLLFRLSVIDVATGNIGPDPVYGDQLQPFGVEGVPGEASVNIEYEEVWVDYDDGSGIALRAPSYVVTDWAYGPPSGEVLLSPRVAPQMIGLGLLAAIPVQRLRALADPEDLDGDGIRGRLQRVWSLREQAFVEGRFGWKAEQPTVEQQVAGAFLGDLGVTTELFPEQNCSEEQVLCLSAETGGEPEASPVVLERVTYYSKLLAPPARLEWASDEVLLGKWLFSDLGCAACHVPSHETGEADIVELSHQRIWPYTDLLLHDLGEELADQRPSAEASGRDYRTPPLWGIGRVVEVNRHDTLLHDGRARGVEEAIVWHGGEAAASQRAFLALEASERGAVVRFVQSL